MRTKVTLFLLFLNVALFFFIFRFERDWRTERATLEVRRKVLGPETAAIRSITVTSPGGALAPYRLEKRSEESWFLTEPLEWPANLPAVQAIVSGLQQLENITSFSVRDVLKNGQSLADYGLDRPRLVVTLASGVADATGAATVTTTLRIGETTKPDAARGEQSLFVLSPDGTRIHVVGRELVDSLSQPLERLRADNILLIPVYEARSLTLQAAAEGAPGSAPAPGPRVRLRADHGRWIIEAPLPDVRADKDLTELAINELDALRVKSFVSTPPSGPLPSAAPLLTAAVDGNNRHETLYLGQPAGSPAGGEREYYAQLEGRPALFTVALPDHLMGTLTSALVTLRDRHVLDFDPAAVTAITLAAPSGRQPEIILQRLEASAGVGPGWQIVQRGDGVASPQRADPAAVQALLGQLALLTVRTFQSDAPQAADMENWGFNLPERVISLSLAAAPGAVPAAPLVLQVGVPARSADLAYAKLANTQSVYEVGPDILHATPVSPRDWRDRLLPFLPAGAHLTAVRLTDLAGKSPPLEWQAEGATGAARDLDDDLGTLRAGRFIQDRFGEEPVKDEAGVSRPWRYRIEAALSLPTGTGGAQARTATLLLTERTSGSGQYAGSADFNAVFALEQPMISHLWTLTYGARDPGPLPAAPAPAPAAAP
jgi:hypothetical protein